MKLFPQLALVSAIAISGNAMAMQALDDSALSATTGQDGITITIAPAGGGISIDQIVVNDANGLGASGAAVAGLTGNAGAITLGTSAVNGPGVTNADFRINTSGIDVVIDADGNSGAPVLNVGIKLNNASITTGDIGVAVGDTTGVSRKATTVTVLDSITVNLGTTDLNVQLGNEAQGSMIQVNATVAGGLVIQDFALRDAGTGTGTGGQTAISGGKIAVGTITVKDAGAATTDLTINTDIDVSAAGLVITSQGGPVDVLLNDVRLGASTKGATAGTFAAGSVASLGNVGLFGLNMTGTTITVAGRN